MGSGIGANNNDEIKLVTVSTGGWIRVSIIRINKPTFLFLVIDKQIYFAAH